MGTVNLSPAHTSLQKRSGSESEQELANCVGKDCSPVMLSGPSLNLLRKHLHGCLTYIYAVLLITSGIYKEFAALDSQACFSKTTQKHFMVLIILWFCLDTQKRGVSKMAVLQSGHSFSVSSIWGQGLLRHTAVQMVSFKKYFKLKGGKKEHIFVGTT